MKLNELLIPAIYADLFADIARHNGGMQEMDSKGELVVPKSLLFELFRRMIPADLGTRPVKNEFLSRDRAKVQEVEDPKMNSITKNEPTNAKNESEEISGPKNELADLFSNTQTPKNELNSRFVNKASKNQSLMGAIPDVILQDWRSGDKNLIRAIFDYKNQPLKDVAHRYGGNSAAANIANYLAKTDEELKSLRRSTATRLANAMQVPEDWILSVRK